MVCARSREQHADKENATLDPSARVALRTVRADRCPRIAMRYFVGAPLSSTSHGQKFWGLRVWVAFLITVIFMILLRFG